MFSPECCANSSAWKQNLCDCYPSWINCPLPQSSNSTPMTHSAVIQNKFSCASIYSKLFSDCWKECSCLCNITLNQFTFQQAVSWFVFRVNIPLSHKMMKTLLQIRRTWTLDTIARNILAIQHYVQFWVWLSWSVDAPLNCQIFHHLVSDRSIGLWNICIIHKHLQSLYLCHVIEGLVTYFTTLTDFTPSRDCRDKICCWCMQSNAIQSNAIQSNAMQSNAMEENIELRDVELLCRKWED